METTLKDAVMEIDNNTFVLASSFIAHLQQVNTGNFYEEIDEFLKTVEKREAYIICNSSIINYLTKFHKLEFTDEYVGGIVFKVINYTATKKLSFIIQ